jgi:hypothetical protein
MTEEEKARALFGNNLAHCLAPYVMDKDRCEFIGRPKTPPCGDGCDCWKDAQDAANAVLELIESEGM